jgi:hypothetical protein
MTYGHPMSYNMDKVLASGLLVAKCVLYNCLLVNAKSSKTLHIVSPHCDVL